MLPFCESRMCTPNSSLHVRFDEVGLCRGGASSALLHNTKFGPFDLLPLKGDPSKVRSHACANYMVYGRQIRYICLLCDNPRVFQIFVAPSNP